MGFCRTQHIFEFMDDCRFNFFFLNVWEVITIFFVLIAFRTNLNEVYMLLSLLCIQIHKTFSAITLLLQVIIYWTIHFLSWRLKYCLEIKGLFWRIPKTTPCQFGRRTLAWMSVRCANWRVVPRWAFFIFCECEIVCQDCFIVPTNNILTRCLTVGCIVESGVKLDHFFIVCNGLLIVLLLFSKLGSHIECDCILFVCVDLFRNKLFNLSMFTSREQPMIRWSSSTVTWLAWLQNLTNCFIILVGSKGGNAAVKRIFPFAGNAFTMVEDRWPACNLASQ